MEVTKDLGEDLVGNGLQEFERRGRRRHRLGKQQDGLRMSAMTIGRRWYL